VVPYSVPWLDRLFDLSFLLWPFSWNSCSALGGKTYISTACMTVELACASFCNTSKMEWLLLHLLLRYLFSRWQLQTLIWHDINQQLDSIIYRKIMCVFMWCIEQQCNHRKFAFIHPSICVWQL
jgi:hypothetical protein